MGRATSKGNEVKSNMKHPSDMPMPSNTAKEYGCLDTYIHTQISFIEIIKLVCLSTVSIILKIEHNRRILIWSYYFEALLLQIIRQCFISLAISPLQVIKLPYALLFQGSVKDICVFERGARLTPSSTTQSKARPSHM